MPRRKKRYLEWNATHTGWLLLAPFYLAEVETGAPVPIPRWHLGWWCDLNMWIQDNVINLIAELLGGEFCCGYIFYGVKPMKKPRIFAFPYKES